MDPNCLTQDRTWILLSYNLVAFYHSLLRKRSSVECRPVRVFYASAVRLK